MPLYAQHFDFLITRAGWLVTKIYAHYTFEQAAFKKDFVIMNQVSRQKAKTKVEKEFYKLMNNSNFGNDCCNNIDNCSFKTIYDNTEENPYIQKYASVYYNDDYKDFACPEIIKSQTEQDYNNETMLIKKDDPCAEAKLHCVGQKRAKKMDSVESMIPKARRKKAFKDTEQKTIDHLKNLNAKILNTF